MKSRSDTTSSWVETAAGDELAGGALGETHLLLGAEQDG